MASVIGALKKLPANTLGQPATDVTRQLIDAISQMVGGVVTPPLWRARPSSPTQKTFWIPFGFTGWKGLRNGNTAGDTIAALTAEQSKEFDKVNPGVESPALQGSRSPSPLGTTSSVRRQSPVQSANTATPPASMSNKFTELGRLLANIDDPANSGPNALGLSDVLAQYGNTHGTEGGGRLLYAMFRTKLDTPKLWGQGEFQLDNMIHALRIISGDPERGGVVLKAEERAFLLHGLMFGLTQLIPSFPVPLRFARPPSP
jgi:hypothetical protein